MSTSGVFPTIATGDVSIEARSIQNNI